MAPEVERKLAAILSADVVGYSRLMAEDEAATVRTLTDYREEIAMLVRQHRGRVVDSPGDNLLAEFPTATDAVSCAVEVQGSLRVRNVTLPADRKMEYRVGIHLGEVRVEGDRIYGDGVNIAARLEGLAEPGGICISATVHEQVRNKLQVGYDDLGDQTVKNIPDPVRAYRVRLDEARADSTKPTGQRWRRLKVAAAYVAALLLLVAVGLWASWPRPLGLLLDLTGASGPPVDPGLPGKPSIVVLPFENLSGDPEQEYFVDGVTEELTSALSRSPGLFVISRNSAFTYKGEPVNVADVGRELGVRYVLEGSVRKAEGRVRITAQLIDATQDTHLWSEQYDRELTDIFALQSEVADKILVSLVSEVRDAELELWGRARTRNVRAYDAWLRGAYEFEKFRRASNPEARRWFGRAIDLDPAYGEAHAMYGLTHLVEYAMYWGQDPQLLEIAEASTRRALELDPESASAWSMHANLAFSRGEFSQALDAANRAIELMPNFDVFHLVRGYSLAGQGRFLPALQSIGQAFRLNPRGTATSLSIAAAVNYRAGRTAKAVELAELARDRNPDLIAPRFLLAAHYESAGRHDEAQTLVQEILRVNPEITTDLLLRSRLFTLGDDADAQAETLDRLRRAGLP